MLENATRICEARFGNLVLLKVNVLSDGGDAWRAPSSAEMRRREPIIRPPKSRLGRVAKTRQIAHIVTFE